MFILCVLSTAATLLALQYFMVEPGLATRWFRPGVILINSWLRAELIARLLLPESVCTSFGGDRLAMRRRWIR